MLLKIAAGAAGVELDAEEAASASIAISMSMSWLKIQSTAIENTKALLRRVIQLSTPREGPI